MKNFQSVRIRFVSCICALPIIFLLSIGKPVFAKITAVTQDGREVILSDNGTWKYASPKKDTSRKHHFRHARWGMSQAQVKASEKPLSPISEDTKPDSRLVVQYAAKVAGLDVLIDYDFMNDKLVQAKYRFQETHANKNRYLDDYTVVTDALTEKYSKPDNTVRLWLNKEFKKSHRNWGHAVQVGHLTMADQWETPDTSISALLKGVNNRIELLVMYKSKTFAGLLKQDQTDELKNAF